MMLIKVWKLLPSGLFTAILLFNIHLLIPNTFTCQLRIGEGTTISIQIAGCQIITTKCGNCSNRKGYKTHERLEEEHAGIGGSFIDDTWAAS